MRLSLGLVAVWLAPIAIAAERDSHNLPSKRQRRVDHHRQARLQDSRHDGTLHTHHGVLPAQVQPEPSSTSVHESSTSFKKRSTAKAAKPPPPHSTPPVTSHTLATTASPTIRPTTKTTRTTSSASRTSVGEMHSPSTALKSTAKAATSSKTSTTLKTSTKVMTTKTSSTTAAAVTKMTSTKASTSKLSSTTKSSSITSVTTVSRRSTTTHAASTTTLPSARATSAPASAISTRTGCPTLPGGIKSTLSTPGGLGITTVSKTADGPAPTRAAVECVPPPMDFSGTARGFTDMCAGVRYCDPAAKSSMTWTGPNGEITRTEIETLLAQLQGTGTHYYNGDDSNMLSDGWVGLSSYSAGLLFEATGDRRALDVVVRIADNILATRNDPVTGRVMWTGNREPIWPTKPENGNTATYYGCESMHVVGHMVNTAVYILKTPCLWNLHPQLTSAPTTFPSNATYLDRALAYVAAGDQTVQEAYIPYYFNSAGLMIQPNDPRYSSAHDFQPGTWMPWNRRSMMIHGLIRLATAHGMSPAGNATYAAQYDQLVDANIADFVGSLTPTTSQGYPTYIWYYARSPPGGSIEFVHGIHAFYDIWGAWIAWQHGSMPSVLTDEVMQNLANTMQYNIWRPVDQLYNTYVNGMSNPCDPEEAPMKYLWSGAWAFYGRWMPAWYQEIIASDTSPTPLSESWYTGPMLWAKAAMHRQRAAFWKGAFSTSSPLSLDLLD